MINSNPDLSDFIAAASAATVRHRTEKERAKVAEDEAVSQAQAAFSGVASFLSRLEAALKVSTEPWASITQEGEWMVGAGMGCFGVYYKFILPRGGGEFTFWVSGDFQRVEFEKFDFALADTDAIETALKAWTLSRLR
jgi:hypothetical protein